jgi:flagellar protein FliS
MAQTGIQTYQTTSVRSEIEGASPHRLVQLMMERVLTKIRLAGQFMENGSICEKGLHIGDAISLIDGLQVSLNHKPDAELAGNFDALYDYMKRRLLEANLRNDSATLEEVSGLMRELKSAWDAIAQ